MLDYLRGEVYRLLHKRSMYIYLGALALAYLALAFIRSAGFDENAIISDAEYLYPFLPALVGGFMFAAIYTDDLNSRNLTVLVGYGLPKLCLVIAKLLLMLLFTTAVFVCVLAVTCLAHTAMGWPPRPEALRTVGFLALQHLLSTVAWAALAGLVVYGLQRTTFAIVAYVLLSLGIVGSLMTTVLDMDLISSVIPDLKSHLMSGISMRLTLPLAIAQPEAEGAILQALFEYLIYVAASTALSTAAFTRREMEF
jgi:hypothetical protein